MVAKSKTNYGVKFPPKGDKMCAPPSPRENPDNTPDKALYKQFYFIPPDIT